MYPMFLEEQEMEMRRNILGFDSAVMALSVIGAFAVALPRSARADEVTPPSVPGDIQVEAGNTPFLVGHAYGTQNYICLPTATGFAFSLFTPEATLFDNDMEQVITHFFSPNPAENGVVRATWLHSRDSSTVWAALVPPAVTVDQDAIPWLLLKKVGVLAGPTGGDVLTATTFVQRVNTVGGVAPSTGCASLADVGKKAFVPYTADYFFWKKTGR
jgi:Protein of unknown function (DUF3455)